MRAVCRAPGVMKENPLLIYYEQFLRAWGAVALWHYGAVSEYYNRTTARVERYNLLAFRLSVFGVSRPALFCFTLISRCYTTLEMKERKEGHVNNISIQWDCVLIVAEYFRRVLLSNSQLNASTTSINCSYRTKNRSSYILSTITTYTLYIILIRQFSIIIHCARALIPVHPLFIHVHPLFIYVHPPLFRLHINKASPHQNSSIYYSKIE